MPDSDSLSSYRLPSEVLAHTPSEAVSYTHLDVYKRQRTYDQAARMGGITGENLLKLLECRLDNVVYRLGKMCIRDRS